MDKLPEDQHKIMSYFLRRDNDIHSDALIDLADYGDGSAVQNLVDAEYVSYEPEMNNKRYITATSKGQAYRRHWFPAYKERIFDLTMENRELIAKLAGMPKHADSAIRDVVINAYENAHKKPNMRTLMEEIAEAILSDRGKHEHPLRLELTQIAGVCINMIRQIDAGEEFKP